MQYEVDLAIAPLTTKAAPVEVEFPVVAGTVDQVQVEFPAGCMGLVGVRIYWREFQLWPTNREGWFRSDDFVISFPESLELTEAVPLLRAVGYNDDDYFTHTPIVRLSITKTQETLEERVAALIIPPPAQRATSEELV